MANFLFCSLEDIFVKLEISLQTLDLRICIRKKEKGTFLQDWFWLPQSFNTLVKGNDEVSKFLYFTFNLDIRKTLDLLQLGSDWKYAARKRLNWLLRRVWISRELYLNQLTLGIAPPLLNFFNCWTVIQWGKALWPNFICHVLFVVLHFHLVNS